MGINDMEKYDTSGGVGFKYYDYTTAYGTLGLAITIFVLVYVFDLAKHLLQIKLEQL
jgi:hypothetical protein